MITDTTERLNITSLWNLLRSRINLLNVLGTINSILAIYYNQYVIPAINRFVIEVVKHVSGNKKMVFFDAWFSFFRLQCNLAKQNFEGMSASFFSFLKMQFHIFYVDKVLLA